MGKERLFRNNGKGWKRKWKLWGILSNAAIGALLSLLGNELGSRWYGEELKQQEQPQLNH